MGGVRTLATSLMIVLLLVGTMAAQGGATGAITGTVSDSTGAVVPNAEVKIVNKATGEVTRTTKTDTAGVFNALLMPVGTYDVLVNAPGFGQVIVQNLAVRVTETTRMYAKLMPKKVTEQVEVEAEVQSVETTNATTGESIESRTIRTNAQCVPGAVRRPNFANCHQGRASRRGAAAGAGGFRARAQ